METKDVIRNPVLLKIDLMIKGVKLPAALYKRMVEENNPLLFEGLDLEMEDGIQTRVPYHDAVSVQSPYALESTMDAISACGYRVPVRVVEHAALSRKKTSGGVMMSAIAHVSGKYLAVTPGRSCGFFGQKLQCAFCTAPGITGGTSGPVGVDDVLETIREVYKTEKPSVIVLSIDDMRADDAGVRIAERYLRAMHRHFNVMVILEIAPPKDPGWIETAYGAGADAICLNLDVFDERLFERICPGKAADDGRQRYMRALNYASGIFPNGTVFTHLIIGMEPLESTINGIEYLASAGIAPILSIFRPVLPSMMQYYIPLSVEEMLVVYKAVHCSLKRHGISSSWAKHMGFAVTPAETKLLSCKNGLKRKINLAIENSDVVDTIKAGMLRMRRSLRVKEV